MIPEFDRMIFNLNDGVLHAGILPEGHYITGFKFIMSMVMTAVIMVGYTKIVVWSDWYEEHEEFFYNTLPKILVPIDILIIFLIALYFKAYGEILFLISFVDILLIVGIRKEFAGFRQWLDEKFGWLF